MGNVITLKEYLDEEMMGLGSDIDFYDRLTATLGEEVSQKLKQLEKNLYGALSFEWTPVEDIVEAEEEYYGFIYSNPELARLAYCHRRSEEERAIDFVLENTNSGSLLDLGSGPGTKTAYYALIRNDSGVFGLDKQEPSLKLLVSLKEKYGLNNLGILRGDLLDLNLSRSFDNVAATNMLHESGDNRSTPYGSSGLTSKVDGIHRHLNPGGKFVATLMAFGYSGIHHQLSYELEKKGFRDIKIDENLMQIREDIFLMGVVGTRGDS